MNATSAFLRQSVLTIIFASLFAIHPAHSEILTGGIGEDFGNIAARTKEFPLRLTFSEGQSGAFISDVTLGIYDAQNKLVLYKKGVGPIALVNLPDGEYKVVAIYEHEKRSTVVTLDKAQNKRIYFNWPGTEDSEVEPSRSATQHDESTEGTH